MKSQPDKIQKDMNSTKVSDWKKEFKKKFACPGFGDTLCEDKGTLSEALEFIEKEIHTAQIELVDEIFDKLMNSFTWTLNVKGTKKPGTLKVMGDYYIHIKLDEWNKFRKDFLATLKQSLEREGKG